MEIKEAIAKRKSIRAFDPKPVPRGVLEQIMEQALWAPSWGNTQPWGFTIVSGSALELINQEYLQKTRQGEELNPDLTIPVKWNEVQTSRYKGLGRALFQTLGIGREDKEKRNAYYEQMTSCFGAPHMIYLHLEEGFNQYVLIDSGLILQTIALLALERGLGTCFLARSIHYSEVVRRHGRISPDRTLVMGMAIGYPTHDHPANLFRSKRGKLEEFIQWVDG